MFPPICDSKRRFMEIALAEAAHAATLGEVPIGAVLVDAEHNIIASCGNRSIQLCDPTAHAEIMVLREAGLKLQNYRLLGTTMYVTLEPCLMCMGAMIHARIERLVFAAMDLKTGAAISRYDLGRDGKMNHRIIVEYGVGAKESKLILQEFFQNRRKKNGI